MKQHVTKLCFLVFVGVMLRDSAVHSAPMLEIPRFGLIQDMKERLEVHMRPNYLLMPHIYRAFIKAGANPEFLTNHSVSSSCHSGLQSYYTGLLQKKTWAWTMYDSTGKQAAGVFVGATTWAGNYEECLNIPTTDCDTGSGCLENGSVAPHFCSVHMTHAPWRPKMIQSLKLPFPVPHSPFIVDACLPTNCSEEDIFAVVEAFLAIDNFRDNITVKYITCHTRKRLTEDTAALISVIILGIITGLVVMGTTYDIYRRRRKLRIKHGPELTIGYSGETDKFGILKIVVPTRKRRSRRGTLSSSENIDQAKFKDDNFNLPEKIFRNRSTSETIFIGKDSLSLERIQGKSSSEQVQLQNITEETERNNQNEVRSLPHQTSVDSAVDDKDLNPGEDTAMLCGSNETTFSPNSNTTSKNGHKQSTAYRSSVVEVRPAHRQKKLTSSENLFTDLLLSFSFRKNTRHILADGSADTLFCLNGVRVLSIAWIVLGNVYGIMYQNPDVLDNSVSVVKMTQTLWMQMVINTTLAADSFFVLSGTLLAYNFLKIKTKAGRNKKGFTGVMSLREYGFMIVHRLVRIFPCFAVLILVATNLMPFLGRGPRWSYEIDSVKVCKKNWWSNLLFVSNFYDPNNMCQPHTYYLANDFQFFLFSPVVLIPLLIAPKFGLSLIGFFVVAQIVTVSTLNQGINGNVLRMKANNYFSLIYVKPYSRIGVYCIGLGLGYLLFTCDRQMKFRKIPLYCGWILSCLVILLLPYITYLENREGGEAWTGLQTALYEAFSRPAWALALSWVIFACSTGQGAFVGKLLSWNIFLPLCRITYAVFLFHPVLISVVIESSYKNFYLTFGELIYTYLAILICCWGVAFLVISCVECPFTTFESHIRLRFKSWAAARKLKNDRTT